MSRINPLIGIIKFIIIICIFIKNIIKLNIIIISKTIDNINRWLILIFIESLMYKTINIQTSTIIIFEYPNVMSRIGIKILQIVTNKKIIVKNIMLNICKGRCDGVCSTHLVEIFSTLDIMIMLLINDFKISNEIMTILKVNNIIHNIIIKNINNDTNLLLIDIVTKYKFSIIMHTDADIINKFLNICVC